MKEIFMLNEVKSRFAGKKYFSSFSVPAFNLGAIVYAQFPSFALIEEIFKLLLLIATFIFTVVKIYLLILNEVKSRKNSQVNKEIE